MTERNDYSLIEFELDGIIEPEILTNLKPPKVNGAKGVILSGRGPIWLYCYLIHHYHPTKFIAIYDPRIGAIIVQSHHPNYKIGEVLKV